MQQNIEVRDKPPSDLHKPVKIHPAKGGKAANQHAPNDRIYVREVKGRVETTRRLLGFALMAVFLILPWLTYQGEQAILLDILDQRFRIFGLTLWPQDLTILAWIFMVSAFALFLVTTL